MLTEAVMSKDLQHDRKSRSVVEEKRDLRDSF